MIWKMTPDFLHLNIHTLKQALVEKNQLNCIDNTTI